MFIWLLNLVPKDCMNEWKITPVSFFGSDYVGDYEEEVNTEFWLLFVEIVSKLQAYMIWTSFDFSAFAKSRCYSNNEYAYLSWSVSFPSVMLRIKNCSKKETSNYDQIHFHLEVHSADKSWI